MSPPRDYYLGDKRLLLQTQQPSNLVACIKFGAFATLNQADIKAIMNKLPEETPQSVRQQLQNNLQVRIDHLTDLQKAICGTLTPEMVKTIQQHWKDRVPDEITTKWAKQGQLCSALP